MKILQGLNMSLTGKKKAFPALHVMIWNFLQFTEHCQHYLNPHSVDGGIAGD